MYIKKRDKEDNEYNCLQEHTLQRIEQLCGKVWTDYNLHDPGITIADYLNYALYELNYRLGFSVETFLLEAGEKEVSFDRKGMLSKEQLFGESIVTEYDYEQLFRKKNPQLETCSVRLDKATGHYHILISLREAYQTSDINELKKNIRKTYHQYRNIGENLGDVFLLTDLQNSDSQYRERSVKTIPQYKKNRFLPPVSEREEPQVFSTEYYSVQFDFPENYGIGYQGISPSAPIEEKSKIMQLKAYLLIMDTILADVLQQAGQLKTLFDFSGKIPDSVLPEVEIPESRLLIDKEAVKTIQLHPETFYNRQKSNYLDLLDAFYGETTSRITQTDCVFGFEENEKRAKLIHLLPELNANRFRACNVHDSNSEPVIQTMINLLTDNQFRSPETDTLSKYGLRVISDDEFFDKYKFLKNFSFGFEIEEEHLLREVEKISVDYNEHTFHELRKSINLLWYNVLFESFLNTADRSDYYRILTLPESEYLLVFKHPEKKEWINMGLFFKDITTLTRIANLFWEFMRKIKHKEAGYNFYFIEHILLSEGGKNTGKLSVVTSEEKKTKKDKQFIEKLLFERLPAHLLIDIYYVPREQFNTFEHLYSDWRRALESGQEPEIWHTTSDMEDFFEQNKPLYSKQFN